MTRFADWGRRQICTNRFHVWGRLCFLGHHKQHGRQLAGRCLEVIWGLLGHPHHLHRPRGKYADMQVNNLQGFCLGLANLQGTSTMPGYLCGLLGHQQHHSHHLDFEVNPKPQAAGWRPDFYRASKRPRSKFPATMWSSFLGSRYFGTYLPTCCEAKFVNRVQDSFIRLAFQAKPPFGTYPILPRQIYYNHVV